MCCCSFSSFVRSARICASDACIAGSATASASANGMCRWSATRRASSASSARHATLGSGSGLYCATRWAYARTNRGHATPHRPCLSRKAMTTMMVVWREAPGLRDYATNRRGRFGEPWSSSGTCASGASPSSRGRLAEASCSGVDEVMSSIGCMVTVGSASV